MDYFKAFETLKKALEKAAIPVPDGHFAIQVRLRDDSCSGIFYIEAKDGRLFIEPYDYYDNDVDVLTTVKAFKSIAAGKLDAAKAIADGTIEVNGDTERFVSFISSIPKKPAVKRTAAKKTTAKKTAAAKDKPAAKKPAKAVKSASKAVKKETEAVTVKEEAKKQEEKKQETISDVVKTETKPQKAQKSKSEK